MGRGGKSGDGRGLSNLHNSVTANVLNKMAPVHDYEKHVMWKCLQLQRYGRLNTSHFFAGGGGGGVWGAWGLMSDTVWYMYKDYVLNLLCKFSTYHHLPIIPGLFNTLKLTLS